MAAAFLSSLAANGLLLFRFVWTRRSRLRAVAVRVAVFGFATLYALLAVEIGFALLFEASDSFGYTLAAKRWFERHWHPINSREIRDVEHDPAALASRRVAFVVGDSFVAGHGVADYRDRFANVLADGLGDDWEVVILARNGWSTRDEHEAIVGYPAQPEVVVLSYYFNDIDDAAAEHGLQPPEPFRPPPPWLRRPLQQWYSLNFLYWRIYRFWHGAEIDRTSWDWFERIWTREDIWQTHAQELRGIAEHCARRGIRLLVVVFPQLRDIERSRPYTSRVVELMRAHGAEVLDLARHLDGRDPASLIVGALDNHPNEALHREVGEWLLARLREPRAR